MIIEEKCNILESYQVFGNEVTISRDSNSIMPRYSYVSFVTLFKDLDEVFSIQSKVKKQLIEIPTEKYLKLEQIVDSVVKFSHNLASSKFTRMELINIGLHNAFEIVGMFKLGVLFLDKQINEIFYNPRQTTLIVEHAKWGRCITDIFLSKEEIAAFMERAALENNQNLSEEHPTLKGDLITEWFHLRVTIDIPPLSFDGPSFNIRKLNNQHFSLQTLVLNNTLTTDAAVFILLAYLMRVNVTIAGQPSSGKTTLQNALLDMTPSAWRMLSIEDAIETFAAKPEHLIRLKIHSTDYEDSKSNKQSEVTKILHRSPDYLNLGEISTNNHAKAWFTALSSGVPSIQTIHGNNIPALIAKITEIFEIPNKLLAASYPHIIIEITSIWNGNKKIRIVSSISEIIPTEKDQKIYKYLFKTDNHYHLQPQIENFLESYTLEYVLSSLGWTKTNITDLIEKTKQVIQQPEELDSFYEIFLAAKLIEPFQ